MPELDPRLRKILDFTEPPQNGQSARITSQFGSSNGRPPGSSDPHGGLDVNRGHGVLIHGDVGSPVYGRVDKIERKGGLTRIVIEEYVPGTEMPTGYDVEILHTQTQSVMPPDAIVKPGQVIATQGDVGAPSGNFHAHVQIFHGRAGSAPQNPLLHLFRYHFPNDPVPALPQFSPAEVPSRHRGQRPTPDIPDTLSAPQSANPPARAPISPNNPQNPPVVLGPQLQFSPGLPIPGAEGPTSLGGPNGPTPLVLPQPASDQGKRSDVPGDMTPDATQATAQATPANWAFSTAGAVGLDDVLKYFNSAPPARRSTYHSSIRTRRLLHSRELQTATLCPSGGWQVGSSISPRPLYPARRRYRLICLTL